jgi:hypothetical protein
MPQEAEAGPATVPKTHLIFDYPENRANLKL